MNSDNVSFNEILTYSVQDMGNSLSIITTALEHANTIDFGDKNNSVKTSIYELLYETSRVHADLLHIYHLYQINHNNYQPQIDEFCIFDFIEDQIIQSEPLIKPKNISIEVEGDEDLCWGFDQTLLRGLIHYVISSTIRYAKLQMSIVFKKTGDYLIIEFSDDSSGYPENLFVNEKKCQQGLQLPHSSVGLGIYYALRIAQFHRNENKQGYITIDNSSSLGGGKFTLAIP